MKIKFVLLFISYAMLFQLGQASVLSNLAASMKPGEWKELVTDSFNVNGKNIMDRCVHSLLAFSNSVFWDSTKSQMYILGSGHGEWATGNCIGFLRYDEATNTWTTLEKPPFYTDMQHAWDMTAFDPVKRDFYQKTSVTEATYKYNIDSAQWNKVADLFDDKEDCRLGALEFFPEMKSLFYYQSTQLLDLQTHKWTPLTNPYRADNYGYNVFAEYNSRLKIMLAGGGGNSNKLYRINGQGEFVKEGPAPIPLAVTKTVQFANSTTGKFIFYDMLSRTLYNYDAFADTWKAEPDSAPMLNNYADYQNLVGGYLSTHKVAIFLQWRGLNSKIYLFKPDPTLASPTSLYKQMGLADRGMRILPNENGHVYRIRFAANTEKGDRLSIFDLRGQLLQEWKLVSGAMDFEWHPNKKLQENLVIFRLSKKGQTLESEPIILRE